MALQTRPPHPPVPAPENRTPRKWILERRPQQPGAETRCQHRGTRRSARQRKAVKATENRRTTISLDGVARDAHLVATSDVWAARFRTGGADALTALIYARGIDLRTLELSTVTSNLAALVGHPPTH